MISRMISRFDYLPLAVIEYSLRPTRRCLLALAFFKVKGPEARTCPDPQPMEARMNGTSLRLSGVLLCALLWGTPAIDAQSTHWLQVSRVTGIEISEADADRILREATILLRTRDSTDDVAALVSLCQEKRGSANSMPGCLDSHSTAPDPQRRVDPIIEIQSPATISNQKQFTALMKTRGYIKVVLRIDWCEGRTLVGPGHFAGCSQVGGIAVQRIPEDPPLEAVVWAHEYGHSKGLDHREAPLALMNHLCKSKNRTIDLKECRAFLKPQRTGDDAHSRIRPYDCHR